MRRAIPVGLGLAVCLALLVPASATADRQTYQFVQKWAFSPLLSTYFQPYGMSLAPNGDLLVASHDDYAAQYTTQGVKVAQLGLGDSNLSTVDNIAARGNDVWVLESGGGLVDKLDSSGAYANVSLSGYYGSAFDRAAGVAVDASGCVYVADGGSSAFYSHRVSKFLSDGTPLTHFGDTSSDHSKLIEDCRSIAIGPHFEVYVADFTADRVWRYTPAKTDPNSYTLTAQWASDSFESPSSVSVDSSGNVLVLDDSSMRITKLDPSGRQLAHWGSHGNVSDNGVFKQAWSVVAAPNGRVFVDDRDGNTVQEFKLLDLPPKTSGYANVSVKKGKKVSLKYKVDEDIGSMVTVTLKVYKGATPKATIVCGKVTQGAWHTKSWTCKLAKGSYTWKVYATDGAGHKQANVASKKLTVK